MSATQGQGPPPPRPRRRLPSNPVSPNSGWDSDDNLTLEQSRTPPASSLRSNPNRISIRREGPLPPIPPGAKEAQTKQPLPALPPSRSDSQTHTHNDPPLSPQNQQPLLAISIPASTSPKSSSQIKTSILSPRLVASSPPEAGSKFPQAPAPQLNSPSKAPAQRPPGLPGGGSFTALGAGGGSMGGGLSAGDADEREKERNNVAREIYETEKKYVDSLNEMITCYQKPLFAASDDPNNHMNRKDIKMMFSNVEVLYNLNKSILDQLKSRVVDNWSPTQKIGDVFRQFAPYLKMYTAYGQGYQPALDQYNTLMKENPKFGELLNQYRGGKPLTLEHLLIMPVQRVPRYNLLLSDFLKKTDPSHPDYQDIDLAIKAVEEAAAHMNQTMRKAEQMTRLVQNASAEAVGGLLEASRSLLMDGVFNCDMFSDFPSCVSVAKQNLFTSGGKKTDKMHLFCFNDILVYIKQSEVKQTKDFSKTTTNMHFNLVWVEEKGESLMIRCPNRRLVVHFPTPAEKSKWLTEITNCIFRSLVPYPEGGTPTKTGANPVPPGLRYGEYMWGDGLDISYKGWWLGAHMHTEGAFTCNGNHYEGGFTSGQKQGSGKLTYSTGFVYEGEFNKDFPNGEGKLTSPTKEVYRGTFKDGRMNGHGVLEWPNGDKCTADWENNRACGRAKLLTKSGISYDGEVKDNLPHGNGTVTMGSLYYMGMWEYGERHGQGTMDYGNGIKYEGTWEDDKYHGRGVLTNSQDGSRYEGEFVNGRKCGMGGMKFGNGDRYEGQWKNDAPHGKGEMIYGNKDVYQGTWKSGKHHGTGVFTYENGTKVDGKWTMGQLEGNTKVSPGSNVWNVPKNGIPSVGFGDYAVNTEPLPELPKRLNFSFC